MFIQNDLKKIASVLVAICPNTFHYTAPSNVTTPYVVWSESGENIAVHSDNKKEGQSISGYIDLFTLTEFEPLFDEIQTALNNLENLGFEYENTMRGDVIGDDNLIHHTWSFTFNG